MWPRHFPATYTLDNAGRNAPPTTRVTTLMTDRLDLMADFARAVGIGLDTIEIYKQDAGARRYYTIRGRSGQLIVDAPPHSENTAQFLRVNDILTELGVTAPIIYEADAQNGLLLIEKLGDTHLGAISDKSERHEAYKAALQVTRGFEKYSAHHASSLAVWEDRQIVQQCLDEFLGWWWPEAFGVPPAQQVRRDLETLLMRLLANRPIQTAALVHRDFFSSNLMWLPQRQGNQRIGVIDHQSASIGTIGYDALSLLQDARCAVPFADDLASFYAGILPKHSPLDTLRLLDTFAVVRHLRVVGVWARIAKRGRIEPFASFAPRTWGLLNAALRTDAGAQLGAWFDEHVPLTQRRQPLHLSSAV